MAGGRPTIFAHAEQSSAAMHDRLAASRARILSQSNEGGLACAAAELMDDLVRPAHINAAFVAVNEREALAAINVIDSWLALGPAPAVRIRRGVVLATGAARPRVGLLLPGQGVLAPHDVGAIATWFPETAAAHARADVP